VLFHERFDVFVQVHAMPTGFGDADAPIARPSASGALLRNREHAAATYRATCRAQCSTQDKADGPIARSWLPGA
jgi:hypothetical protein